MTALTGFELQKVWRKGSFLSLMVLLLLLNVFLLWYVNRPAGDEPPLSAYKAVCQDISYSYALVEIDSFICTIVINLFFRTSG